MTNIQELSCRYIHSDIRIILWKQYISVDIPDSFDKKLSDLNFISSNFGNQYADTYRIVSLNLSNEIYK
jgi:hypothetical protein